MYGYCDEFLNKIYFYILFIGVNVTFFPIHQIGILRMPRRYFSYREVYTNLNIITFVGTLFTVLGWVILMFIIYNVICIKVGIRGYTRFADSVYRANLPHHTYISGVFGNGGKKFLELLAGFCFRGRIDNNRGNNKGRSRNSRGDFQIV